MMTLKEFNAWLEGFTDGMYGAPNDAQWSKIKKRLRDVDEQPTERVTFVDRYYPQWHQPMYAIPSTIPPNVPYCGINNVGGGLTPGGEGKMTGVGFYSEGELYTGMQGAAVGAAVAYATGWASPAMTHSTLPTTDFDSLKAFSELGHAEYLEIKNKQAA